MTKVGSISKTFPRIETNFPSNCSANSVASIRLRFFSYSYIKETKQYIVFQEYYKTEVNTPEVVETIKEVNTGRRVVLHATRDDESVIDLRTHGIGATKNEQSEKNKDKAMMDRIKCMIDVVQQGRILFSVGCPKTLEDFKELSWSDKQAEKDKEEIEKPLTKHLPGVDCLSYVVYFIEKSYGRVK